MIRVPKTQKGVAVTEYAILASLIGAIAIGAVLTLGTSTSDQFSSANDQLEVGINTAANGNGNGNNGNGNGNGGASGPDPDTNTCYVDTAGDDTITSTEVPETTDCVVFENGGTDTMTLLDRTSPLTITSIAPPSGDYDRRTFSADGNDNTMVLINGRHLMFLGNGNNTIDATNHNLSDMGFLAFSNGEQLRFEKFDRSFELVIQNFLGGNETSINSIQFADRTLSSQDIHDLFIESQFNNYSNGHGTVNDDMIELRCHNPPAPSFSHFRSVYGNDGNDTYTYIAGRQRMDASGAEGFDRMIFDYNSTDVSFETSGSGGSSLIIRFPTGDFINFNFLVTQYNAGDPTNIDELVFNDTTMDVADMIARAAVDTPLPAFASNCPAQGSATGQQLLWPNGPYDGDHPNYVPPAPPEGGDG